MNNFIIPLKGNNSRRPSLEAAQDETARVSQPKLINAPDDVGEPISEEEFSKTVLERSNTGKIDLGEFGEPITEQQFLNRARVKKAAEMIPELVKKRHQEYLKGIKEDEPGWKRAMSAANSVVKGGLESIPSAYKTGAILTAGVYNYLQGENTVDPRGLSWYTAGENMAKDLNEAFPESEFYRNEFWAGTIAKGSGQMIGNLLAAYATGGQSAWASAAGSALFNATLSSQYYEEAINEGATNEEAISNTLVNMVGVSAMEAIPMARLVRRVNKVTGNGFGTILKNGFKGSIEEGVQEAVQTMYTNVAAQDIYDSSRDVMDGVWEAAGAGAILGSVANVGISTLMRRSDSQLIADRLGAEQGVVSIARYYGDMLPRFQDMSMEERVSAIREFIHHRREQGDQVTISEAGSTTMGVYSPEVTPIEDLDGQKFKKLWTKYLKTGGLEGKRMQVFRERRDARIDKELEEMQINIHGLNRGILSEYNSSYKKDWPEAARDKNDPVPEDIALKIDKALRGEDVSLPEKIEARVTRMRKQIDNLGKTFIKKGFISGDLLGTFINNFGSYVHRDYKLFNPDVRWDKSTIPSDVWNRGLGFMRSYLKGQIKRQEQQSKQRQEKLKALIKQGVPIQQRQRELGESVEQTSMTEEQINREAEKRLKNIISRRGAQSIHKMFNNTEFSKDAGDRDVLMKREDIPKPIRDVMGEYKDGAVNYVNTVNKMANHLYRREFLDTIAEEFRGSLFYTRQEIDEQGLDITKYTPDFSDGGLNSKLTATGKETLFMHRDLHEAMMQSMDPNRDHGALMTMYLRGIGGAKYAKTVLSHVAHIRNLVGGTSFLLNQGLFFQAPGTGKGSFRRAMTVFRTYEGLSNKQLEERWKKYVDFGLTGGSIREGEMKDILGDMQGREFDNAQQFMEEMFNHHKAAKKGAGAYNTGKSWFKKFARKSTNVYKAEDAFLRVWMFEMEKARLQEADPSITEREVADIVNDLYPNYDRVNNAIKGLRKWPIAPFISFPAEVVRTSLNTVRRARTEINSDNVKLQKIGYKRIGGMMTNLVGWSAIGAASQAVLGMTDEEEQSVREFLPPWARNSSILYLSSNDGKIRYINLSYTNPYELLTDPIFSAIKGGSDREIQDRFMGALQQMFEPIYNPEIFAKALGDLYYNNSDGNEIWNPEAPLADKLQQQFLHMWDSVEPGSLTSAQRFFEPIVDEQSSRNVSDELMGLMGVRVSTVDVKRSFGFRIRDFRQRIRDTKRLYNSIKYKKGTSRSEEREALERANESYESVFREMKTMTDAAEETGIRWRDLRDIMKDSGLANRDINGLRRGRFTPFER